MQATNDWQIGKNLSDRMKYMLENRLMCDVKFRVGTDETEVFAHKYMLASASPVFYSMFEGPMAETGEIAVPDIEPDIFENMLKFIYTDEINISSHNIKGMLHTSEKYMLQTIKDKCRKYLTFVINEDEACVVLQYAHDYIMTDLEKKALHYILENGKNCLGKEEFLRLSAECLEVIIESDNLQCKEEFIYERLIEWVKCKSESHSINDEEIRTELGKLLHLIRFPIMDQEYFTNEISIRKILTADEIIQVYQSHNKRKIDIFPSKPRIDTSIEFMRCTADVTRVWPQGGQKDCIDFQTNFDCTLTGIKLFGSTSYDGKHDVAVDIKSGSSIIATEKKVLFSQKGIEIYTVDFIFNPAIKKNTRYTIQLTMKGKEAFRGKNYVTEVKVKDFCVSFMRSSTSPNATNEVNGQIPGLLLRPRMLNYLHLFTKIK